MVHPPFDASIPIFPYFSSWNLAKVTISILKLVKSTIFSGNAPIFPGEMGPFFLRTRPVDVGGQRRRWELRRGTSQAGAKRGLETGPKRGGKTQKTGGKSLKRGKHPKKWGSHQNLGIEEWHFDGESPKNLHNIKPAIVVVWFKDDLT